MTLSELRIIQCVFKDRRSQWPHGLRRRSAAERLLGSWVRIPPRAWMFVSCTVFVLSGGGLCDGPIPRPEESYRLWRVSECDQVKINNLDTYCEQVGRRGKHYGTKRNKLLGFSLDSPTYVLSDFLNSIYTFHLHVF